MNTQKPSTLKTQLGDSYEQVMARAKSRHFRKILRLPILQQPSKRSQGVIENTGGNLQGVEHAGR